MSYDQNKRHRPSSKGVSKRPTSSARRYGAAGSGLGSSSARSRFGDQAEVGASGERYFETLLERAGLTQLYDVHFSLGIPQGRDQKATRYNSDVDAVLVNGNKIVLVDVKRWKGNAIYWSVAGLPFRGLAPLSHDKGWKLSANMAAALRRYKEALPGANITAMVVFVPTQRGHLPTSVRWLKWPGEIRSYLSDSGMKEISRRLGPERTNPHPAITGVLSRLQR